MRTNLYQYIISHKEIKNIFIEAQGGAGKTTQLRFVESKLLERAKNGDKIVPIYIDVKSIDSERINPIYSEIHGLCGTGCSVNDVKDAFEKAHNSYNSGFHFYILIDAINEAINYNVKSRIIMDINALSSKSKNCTIIVTSRVEEDALNSNFQKLKISQIDEKWVVKTIEDKYQLQDHIQTCKIKHSLFEILQIPLFLTTYLNAYPNKKDYIRLYNDNYARKAQILDAYRKKIIEEIEPENRRDTSSNELILFIINYYLPAVAFQMVKANKFKMELDYFEDILNADYFANLIKGSKKKRILNLMNSETFNPSAIGAEGFALIVDNEDIWSFTHHIWRDYFCALHIVNIMKNAKDFSDLEVYLESDIKQFIGELFTNAEGLCECDFELKNKCEEKNMSPVESFMQQNYFALNKTPIVTRNLIEIMKASRNNKIVAYYNNLDLKECDFLNCILDGSIFCNTQVYTNNFHREGHTESVNAVEYFIDQQTKERRIISCSDDGNVFIWNPKNKSILHAFLLSSDVLVNKVCCSENNSDYIMVETPNPIYPNREHYKIPEGAVCAIKTWALVNEQLRICEARAFKSQVIDVDISKDASLVSVSCEHEGIIIYKIFEHRFFDCFQLLLKDNTKYSARKVKIVENKFVLAIINKRLCAFSLNTGKQIEISEDLALYNKYLDMEFIDFSVSTINSVLTLTTENGCIKLFDYSYDEKNECLVTKQKKVQFEISEQLSYAMSNNEIISTIVHSKNNNILALGGNGRKVYLFKYKDSECELVILSGHTGWINDLSFCDEEEMLCSSDSDGTIIEWHLKDNKNTLNLMENSSKKVFSIEHSNNGNFFAVAGKDGIIRIFDENSNKLVYSKNAHRNWIRTLAFSPDDRYIASAGSDGQIKIWEFKNEKLHLVRNINGHKNSIFMVRFDNSGDLILSCGFKENVKLWYWKTPSLTYPIFSFGKDAQTYYQAAFYDDNNFLCCGQRLEMWNKFTPNKCVLKADCTRKNDRIKSFTLRDDSIVTISADGFVEEWKVEDNYFDVEKSVKLHKPSYHSWQNLIILSKNNEILLASNGDLISALDPIFLKETCDNQYFPYGGVSALSINANGTKAVIGGGSGLILCWNNVNGEKKVFDLLPVSVKECDFSKTIFNDWHPQTKRFVTNIEMFPYLDKDFLKQSLYYNGAKI